MKPLRSRAVEQNALSSPLRILAVTDGDTPIQGICYTVTVSATSLNSAIWSKFM
jgi:hypothetical protein